MNRQDHIKHTVHQSGRAAIYARTAAGARTQTAQQEAHTLIELANELGYPNERITLYEDAGTSTRKPLAMRGALSDLLAAITHAEQEQGQERIGSVFVSSPYRLYSDLASADIATFLHTCTEHNVSIVTPDMTFDLRDPAQIALFRFQYEAARQYITAQVKRLKTRKRRVRGAGE